MLDILYIQYLSSHGVLEINLINVTVAPIKLQADIAFFYLLTIAFDW